MTLTDLIEALEKATGPDRWIDAKIDAALRIGSVKMNSGGYEWAWDNFPVWAHHTHSRGMCGVLHDNGDLGLIWDSPDFTASVDAAIALAERVLPGWFWRCGSTPLFPKGWAFVSRTDANNALPGDEHASSNGKAATPAIALCIAILSALQAKEGAKP